MYPLDWTAAIQQNKCLDIIYFDFQKAFDSDSHLRLLQKIQSYGISGDLLHWFSSFLINRTQQVQTDTTLSGPKHVTNGVPQESVLGPTLFFIFINLDLADIINTIPNVTMKLFADDVKLYACSDSCHNLQKAIDKLMDWSDMWQLRLASEKCCMCHVYSRSDKRHPIHQYFKDRNLEHVPITRDLGVFIANNLIFIPHIRTIILL